MRAIKFRAWHKSGAWWPLFYLTHAGHVLDLRVDGQPDITDEVVLEQFTGLYDRNCQEVFEGDIIEMRTMRRMIVWRDGAFWAKDPHRPLTFPAHFSVTNPDIFGDWKVVGNIHQDPDMVKRRAEKALDTDSQERQNG